MKAVILAGGLGTRISEETITKPKPLVLIGGKPILWHIMKIYSSFGINEFIICLGYKGDMIKEYFINYYKYMSDFTINLSDNSINIHRNYSEPWKVTLIDTGKHTMTGSRILKIKKYIENDKAFCMTYGDGVGNIDIKESIEFHFKHKKLATLTGVVPPGRFGALDINNKNLVTSFTEKPSGDGNYINGGFFVLSPKVINYIGNDENTVWEQEPLKNLTKIGELMTFKHNGFWQPMDTLRDKEYLNNLWESNTAPWKIW